MTREERNELRQRILENMDSIEELIASRGAHFDGTDANDLRPRIVESIVKIAVFKSLPAHAEAAKLQTAVGHLKAGKTLVEETRSIELISGFDDWVKQIEARAREAVAAVKARPTGRTEANRKRLAVETACNLMINYGGRRITLSTNSSFVRLANLLYDTAMGLKVTPGGNESVNLYPNCRAHFQALKEEGVSLYSPPGRTQRRQSSPPSSSELDRLMRKDSISSWRQRKAAANWRPLQQVIDEVLGR